MPNDQEGLEHALDQLCTAFWFRKVTHERAWKTMLEADLCDDTFLVDTLIADPTGVAIMLGIRAVGRALKLDPPGMLAILERAVAKGAPRRTHHIRRSLIDQCWSGIGGWVA
jgi:hypothetical protein